MKQDPFIEKIKSLQFITARAKPSPPKPKCSDCGKELKLAGFYVHLRRTPKQGKPGNAEGFAA